MGSRKNKKKDAAALTAIPAEEAVVDTVGETGEEAAEAAENAPDLAQIPQAKTKKEIKQERKEEIERKRQVQLEARRHSVRRVRAEKIGVALLSLMVIACIICSSLLVVSTYRNLNAPAPAADEQPAASQQGSSAAPGGSGGSGGSAAPGASAQPAAPAAPSANVDQNAIDIYKKAHAQALSSAKVIKRTYNNTTNYNEVLEIGSSSVIAGIAKNLMGTFMKEDTSVVEYTGADIAANLPPAKSNTEGLTADMLSEATMTDDGDHYTIKLTINSTEENYDLGEKTNNLCSVMDEEEVKSAASMVTLNGMEVHYIAPTLTATVDKATGNLTHVETDVPAYLCFAEAKVAIVSVKDCRIGLEFMMKFDVEY